MNYDEALLDRILEGALLAAGESLSVKKLASLFEEDDDQREPPSNQDIEASLQRIQERTEERGFKLVEIASGWRFQVGEDLSPWVSRLWDEKPQKYSRALLETLAIIAYRQPLTRGDIEDVRGVAVSSHIIKTLAEREWIKVVGQRDVPGRPSLYATTKQFLDYFGLKKLDELPTLKELQDIDSLNKDLALDDPNKEAQEEALEKEQIAEAALGPDGEKAVEEALTEHGESSESVAADASEAEGLMEVTAESSVEPEAFDESESVEEILEGEALDDSELEADIEDSTEDVVAQDEVSIEEESEPSAVSQEVHTEEALEEEFTASDSFAELLTQAENLVDENEESSSLESDKASPEHKVDPVEEMFDATLTEQGDQQEVVEDLVEDEKELVVDESTNSMFADEKSYWSGAENANTDSDLSDTSQEETEVEGDEAEG